MKKTKKALALILAIVMCFSLFSSLASAELKPHPFTFRDNEDAIEYHMVSIGDSTVTGYGLNDYEFQYGGLGYASKGAICYIFGEYLQKTLGDSYHVVATNLALEGLRTDELRGILDESYEGDSFFQSHISDYTSWHLQNSGMTPHDYYVEKLAEADCIVLDNVMNNFGTYFTQRLRAIFGMDGFDINDYREKVSDVHDKEIAGSKVVIDATVEALVSAFGIDEALGDNYELLTQLLDLFSYCYADFCANFKANIRMIREINPTAKIIVTSSFNPMNNLTLCLEGLDIDFSGFWASYLGLANNYITALCPYNTQYVYADMMSGGVETIFETLAKANDYTEVYKSYSDILYENALELIRGVEGNLSRQELEAMGYTQENVINCCIEAAKNNKLDVMATFGFITAGGYEELVAEAYRTGTVANSPAGISEEIHFLSRCVNANGFGTHPSELGYQQKLQYVSKAWYSVKPAALDSESNIKSLLHSFGSTLLNSFRAPLLEKINELFVSFIDSFVAFWQSILGLK